MVAVYRPPIPPLGCLFSFLSFLAAGWHEARVPTGPKKRKKKEREKEMGQPRSQHYMLSSQEIEIVTRREGR